MTRTSTTVIDFFWTEKQSNADICLNCDTVITGMVHAFNSIGIRSKIHGSKIPESFYVQSVLVSLRNIRIFGELN